MKVTHLPVKETHYFRSWFCFHCQIHVAMLLSLLSPSDGSNTSTIVLVRLHLQLLISRTNNLYLLLLIFDIYSSYILIRTVADVQGQRIISSILLAQMSRFHTFTKMRLNNHYVILYGQDHTYTHL